MPVGGHTVCNGEWRPQVPLEEGGPEGTDVVIKWMRENLYSVDAHPGTAALMLTIS